MAALLAAVERGARMLGLYLNKSKCVYFVDGRVETEIVLRLFGKTLTEVKQVKYLGVIFQADDFAFETYAALVAEKMRKAVGAAKGLMCGGYDTYEIGCVLWTAEVRPIFEYASDVLPLTAQQLSCFQSIQSAFGRFVLQADRLPLAAVLGETGWPSVVQIVSERKYNFALRARFQKFPQWVTNAFYIFSTLPWFACYSVPAYEAASGSSGVSLLSSQLNKREVVAAFRFSLTDSWRKLVAKYASKSMVYYRAKSAPRREWFYDGSAQSFVYLQARTGNLPLRWRSYNYDELGDGKVCAMCGHGDETIFHFLVDCPALPADPGLILEARTYLVPPENGVFDLALILLALGCSAKPNAARQDFTRRAISYVYSRWKERERVTDLTAESLGLMYGRIRSPKRPWEE